MSYEIKVLLIAIAEIISNAKDTKAAYEVVAKMANAEGVILKSFDEKKKES